MTPAPHGTLATDEERAALLGAYDAQLRGAAEVQGAVSWDRCGPLWRALFTREGLRQLRVARGAPGRRWPRCGRRPDRRDRGLLLRP